MARYLREYRTKLLGKIRVLTVPNCPPTRGEEGNLSLSTLLHLILWPRDVAKMYSCPSLQILIY